MSANHNDSKLDVELDRHISALRDAMSPDEGPSVETLAKTQAMIRELSADEGKTIVSGVRRPLYQRLVAMTFAQRIAAVVMITLGALTLYIVFMLFSSLAPTVAFADVATRLAQAHTFSFLMSVQMPGKPSVPVRMFFKDPHHVRMEMPGGMPGGTISITDDRKALILNQTLHTAMVMNIEGERIHRPGQPETVVEAMRSMGQARGETIGEKTIDGIVCTGFKATHMNYPLTVWADKKTAEPVRIEMLMPLGEQQITAVMDHFQLDPPLDDALFSLDVPAGYTPTTQTIKIPKLEELDTEVAKLLKDCADANGGIFPASLTDWSALVKKSVQDQPDNPKALNDVMTRVGVVSGMLYSLPDGYGYAGKGVKLGEKDKIIFWHRPAKNAPTVKAIFGDLRIEDVAADKVPSTQAATTPATKS